MQYLYVPYRKNMKKIPPYGKPLFDLLSSGSRPKNDINLFIGYKAWEKGKAFSISYPCRTLTLPPWCNPVVYCWPVQDCDVLIFDTGYAEERYLTDLSGALFEDGASKIRCVNTDFEIFNIDK